MEYYLAIAAIAFLLVNLVSIIIAARRLSPSGSAAPSLPKQPPASIVIPACGIENFTSLTLAHAFALDWPHYELIFCVADERDPVVSKIQDAIAAHPAVPARILIGDDRISANPKLNNCVKGWRAATNDWVILADSNVLMPPDYVQHLMAGWRKDTGVVCSTPLGSRPDGFWAKVECVFLNTHQARWQYAGEAVGFGFAQGKSMLWYKPMLNAEGGIEALAAEIAEDAAATKLVHGIGRKVHLVASPFEQPLGRRNLAEIWGRQSRWARLRRVTFPAYFAPEILLGSLPPLLFGIAAALIADVSATAVAVAVLLATYLPEFGLALAKNWPVSLASFAAMMVRDIMMPAIWLRSWIGGSFEWRGSTMTIGTEGSELNTPSAA
ncbi:glycosyltransferase [Neorhizobium petrolearium]|uniref:Glycosyltransferase n=1 Tax=Neorhizobium petrolearium TaxID=515361 RepID=A0ABY8M8X0_9HYPH|nr:glycosyltransferase [Neorhizobium petrolearium]MCC2609883.1 glycosyltransferase [Neorhizobium petrolearium]WGI70069.1 glycosyltransferase [Neorhizobium petrolearium]